jgi:protease secretion system membrane fusion protein
MAFNTMSETSLSPSPSPVVAADADGPRARHPARLALWALAAGLVGAVAWAALAPLDEGVPAPGAVAIDTKSKAVQHLAGGIVKAVLVREGQQVQQGQVLIQLDEAAAKAGFEAARQRYLGLRAMEGRLLAERSGGHIAWHADLQAASGDPSIRQMLLTQEQLMQSRRASLAAELRAVDESILGLEAQLKALAGTLAGRRRQLELLREELGNTRELVREGYVPRNRQLELERNEAELGVQIAEGLGNATRTERAIGEQRQRASARRQDYRKEVETQSADVDREVHADAERLRAATDELGRMDIRAPANGQVVGLNAQTVGGVIGAGQKLMDIVPAEQALLLEARVAPHLIDRVHADLPVDVRFSAFANAPLLVVRGQVVSVSADLLTDPRTGIGYYLARIALTPEGRKALGTRQLQPGMPVEAVFITGERSLLTYWLHPLVKRLASSVKEP